MTLSALNSTHRAIHCARQNYRPPSSTFPTNAISILSRTTPCLTAQDIAWLLLLAPSFSTTRLRWKVTVLGVIPNIWAMSLTCLPSAAHWHTSSSRILSASRGGISDKQTRAAASKMCTDSQLKNGVAVSHWCSVRGVRVMNDSNPT